MYKKFLKICSLILILFLFNNKTCFANTEYVVAKIEETEKNINLIVSTTNNSDIYGFLGNIEYDQEKLTLNNCSSNNFTLTKENNKVLLERLKIVKTTELFNCNFTIIKEGQINDFILTNITISNGTNLLTQEDITLKNKVVEEREEIVEKEELKEELKEEKEPEIIQEEKNDNWIFILIIIILLIIIVILLIIIFKKNKNPTIPVALLALLIITQTIPYTKAEIKTNRTQLNELRNMLLGKEFNNHIYDYDEDKKTTINDLILGLIEFNKPTITYQSTKTTGTKEYKVSVVKNIEVLSETKIESIYYCFTNEEECIPDTLYNYQENSIIELKYPDNIEGLKLCLKAKNELGFETITCDENKYKVDSQTPSVSIVKDKVIIGEEDIYETDANLNIKYGISGGNYTCTDEYKLGSNEIICIINSNNGLNTKIKYELYVEETIDIIHFVDSLNPNYITKFVSNVLTIVESNGKFAIIDFGYKENEIDNQKVYDYLTKLGIKEFEFAILTHGHSDHIGFFDDIVEKYSIKSIYMKEKIKDYPDSEYYNGYGKVLSTVEKYNISIKDVEQAENQKITLGDITLDLYNTAFILNESDISKADNANSIALVATIHGKRVYLASDIGEYGALREGLDVEINLAKEIGEVDIYKVAHHGYMTYQNSLTALQYLKPTYSVVNNDENSTQIDGLIDRIKFGNKNYKDTYFTSNGHLTMKFNEDKTIDIEQGT